MNPDGTLEEVIEAVRLAEDVGFDYCYIADQGFSRDVFVILSLIASATSRIHFGPGVTNPYTRHPATAAVAVASLDEASGGRAFLGFGAGGSLVLDPLQVQRVSPLNACREAATIARLLWTRETVNFEGTQFRLTNARLREPGRSDIELHWAARGPRMLALGGEVADVVLLHGMPRFDLANSISHITDGAKEAGRTVKVQYSTPLVFDDRSREAARQRTVYRIVDSTDHVKAELDVAPELSEQMRSLAVTRGPSEAAHLVTDDVLREFVLDTSSDGAATVLRDLFDTHDLDGLTIEIAAPTLAPVVLPRAAELIARL